MYLGELVRHSIRNVCACGRSAVCSENDAVFEVDGHAVRALDGDDRIIMTRNVWSLGLFTYIEVPKLLSR